MIRELNNQGFKDQTQAIKLSGLDLFSSMDVNGVGKSAVLEAFQLALMGVVPGRAKNVENVLQFTSLDSMKIEIIADTRQGQVSIARGFFRHAPHGQKRPVWINRVARKHEEGDQWVRHHIGAVAISFDPFEFLNLNDKKKRQWIVANSPESQNLSPKGFYVFILSYMLKTYLGSGILQSLLGFFGLASLWEVFEVRDENKLLPLKERLVEKFQSQEPKLCYLTLNTLDRVFNFWSPSLSAEQNSNDLLHYLKSESLRLKNAIREQTSFLFGRKANFRQSENNFYFKVQELKDDVHLLEVKLKDLEKKIQRMKFRSAEKLLNYRRLAAHHEKILCFAKKLNAKMGEALRKRRDQLEENNFDIKALEEKQKQHQRELEIIQLIAEGIERIQGEMASRISRLLEAEVNDLLKLIDSEYDFCLNLRGKQFEMGWNRDGKIISFKTINSAHFVLFIAPFLTALMNRMERTREKSGLPTLKALCIEAECLTPGNLQVLLKGLAKIKKRGALDNVLVTHHHSVRDPEKLYGFEEHILVESQVMV